ncbi:MAG: bifunctional transcriptional activator/DNA repair enzyme protein Ada, partial [Nitrospiraceae bacterium]
MTFSNDAQRWDAVTRRDRQADGKFVSGVKTTRIYCRPACSSRLPNPTNVAFFGSVAEAEQAGFRACKRCKPNTTLAPRPHREAIIRACKLIDETEERFSLTDLAASVGLSPYHFHRVFKEIVGITPKSYAAARRARSLRAELRRGNSVTQAIYDAGFGSSSRVYERAMNMLGMTPFKYKHGGAGTRIRFAIEHSFLGMVLVAATERGICTIDFGDTPEVLIARLRARFPKADLQDDDPDFAVWVSQTIAFIDAPR